MKIKIFTETPAETIAILIVKGKWGHPVNQKTNFLDSSIHPKKIRCQI